MGTNRALVGSVMAILLVFSAAAHGALTLNFDRTFGEDGTYPPGGGTVDVTLTITAEGTGSLLSLSVTETIPTGWSYNSLLAGGAGLFVQPNTGKTGTLDYVWLSPPASFPFELSYRLNVPSGQEGLKLISGSGAYNGGTANDTNWGPLDTEIDQTCLVSVPNVVGLTEPDAVAALGLDGLSVGNMDMQPSATVPEGSVISQNPTAQTQVLCGSTVDIVVSSGCSTMVPDVRGVTVSAANQTLTGANLTLGQVIDEYSDTTPAGIVMDQVPAAGEGPLDCGTVVELTVSQGPCMTTVPDLHGMTEQAAMNAIYAATLAFGDVFTDYSETVDEGLVISQSPLAQAQAHCDADVAITLSLGPCRKNVPDVANIPDGEAGSILETEGFVVGQTTQEHSELIEAGKVIRTNPAIDTQVPCGATINLIVSDGCWTQVPNIVGMQEAVFADALTSENLTVGDVSEEYNETVAAGLVISQSVQSGTEVACSTSVDVVISKGQCRTNVPDLTETAAANAGAALTAENLVLGQSTQEHSTTIAAGLIIRTSPAADTNVPCNSVVNIVVSDGCFAVIPNLVGMQEAVIADTLGAANLALGDVTEEYSETVAAGLVISQSIQPQTQVACGTEVNIILSLGPCRKNVPDIEGLAQNDAEAALESENLVVGQISNAHSFEIPAGHVILTNPAIGTLVPCGATINITVSDGCFTQVPNLAGMQEAVVGDTLASANLALGDISEENSDTVAAGLVISQSVQSGSTVPCDTEVSVVVSSGPCMTQVPDLRELPWMDALAALTLANLVKGQEQYQHHPTIPEGYVINHTPGPDASVHCGTAVNLVFSDGCWTQVPNLAGKTWEEATAMLDTASLTVGDVSEEYSTTVPEGKIISQSIQSGTSVRCDTAVDLVKSMGPCKLVLPDLTGVMQTEALQELEAWGLIAGQITEEFSLDIPEGKVIRTIPAEGEEIPCNSVVNLVVSKGCQAVVPGVVGMAFEQAIELLAAAHLTTGEVTEEYSDTVPEGAIIAQSIGSGIAVPCDTAIDLVKSKGQCRVVLPGLTGVPQAEAINELEAWGLTLGQIITEYDSNQPEGKVIRTDPPEGTEVPCGATIDLYVSGFCITMIPNVAGMEKHAAMAEIEDAHLSVGNIQFVYDETIPQWEVISQSPDADTEAECGTAVDLVVSQGPCLVSVPSITGLDQNSATNILKDAELKAGQITFEYSAEVEIGLVISQNPGEGEEVTCNSTVNFIVSLGMASMPVCPEDALYGQTPVIQNEYPYTAEGMLCDINAAIRVYDNFSGVEGAIKDLHWWGWHQDANFGPCTPEANRFRVVFYEDSDGVPGDIVAQFPALNAVKRNTGFGGVFAYDAILPQQVSLASGWISIEGTSNGPCAFAWSKSEDGDANAYVWYHGPAWGDERFETMTHDMAFCLTGGGEVFNGTITGTILNESNDRPLSRVYVDVLDVDGNNIGHTVTDIYGQYTISGIPIEQGQISMRFARREFYTTEREFPAPVPVVNEKLRPYVTSHPAKPLTYSGPNKVYVDWTPNPEYNLKGYHVWRMEGAGTPGDPDVRNWTFSAPVKLTRHWIRKSEFEDFLTPEDAGKFFVYQIQAVSGWDRVTPIVNDLDPADPTRFQYWSDLLQAQHVVLYFPPEVLVKSGGRSPLLWDQDTTPDPNFPAANGLWARIPLCVESAYEVGTASMEITARLPNDILVADKDATVYVETTDITQNMSLYTSEDQPTFGFAEDGILRISASDETNTILYGRGVLFDIYVQVRNPNACVNGFNLELLDSEEYPAQGVLLADELGAPINAILRDGRLCTQTAVACLHGDANEDLTINMTDVGYIRYLSVFQSRHTECSWWAGDIYIDGYVNAQDATKLERWLNGLPINPQRDDKLFAAADPKAVTFQAYTKADNPNLILVPSVYVQEGQTEVTIPVNIDSGNNFLPMDGFELDLAYPVSVTGTGLDDGLSFKSVEVAGEPAVVEGILTSYNALEDNTGGYGVLKLAAAGTGAYEPTKGTAVPVLMVTFTVGEDYDRTKAASVTAKRFEYNDDYGYTPRHDAPGAPVIGGLVVGDVTGDGVANYKDAGFILQSAVGLRTLLNEGAGDVTGDGIVNYKDASWILQAAVGLRTLE